MRKIENEPASAMPPRDAPLRASRGPLSIEPSVPRPIVCAVDFSRTSLAAVEEAARLARRAGAPLHLIHACELTPSAFDLSPTGPEETAERAALAEQMAALCDDLRGRGIEVEGRVVDGAPVVAVTAEVARTSAGLIVMGTRGRTGLSRLALGSVAERLVRAATVSVLTVPLVPEGEPTQPRKVRVVVAAVELDGDERAVLRAATEIDPEATVRAVHVVAMAGSSAVRRAAERALAAAIAASKARDRIAGDLRTGVVHEEIREEVRLRGADCVVVGTHRRGILERFVEDSIAERVIRASAVPVLTVRPFERG